MKVFEKHKSFNQTTILISKTALNFIILKLDCTYHTFDHSAPGDNIVKSRRLNAIIVHIKLKWR